MCIGSRGGNNVSVRDELRRRWRVIYGNRRLDLSIRGDRNFSYEGNEWAGNFKLRRSRLIKSLFHYVATA